MLEFKFDEEKNEKLLRERGISFEMAIKKMIEDDILMDLEHHNLARHPGQRIAVVVLNNYTCCLAYKKEGKTLLLKTLYPDRRFMKYLEK